MEEQHILVLGHNVEEHHILVLEDNAVELHDLVMEDIVEELHNLVEVCNVEALLIVENYNLVVVDMDLDHKAYEAEKEFDFYTFEHYFEDMVVEYLVVGDYKEVDLEVEALNYS